MIKCRPENLVIVILFLTVIFGFAAAFFILPDNAFSEQENRTLQQLPDLSVKTLISGDYSAGINSYYADQFPLRDEFVGIKSAFELFMLKRENNSVTLGSGGTLAVRSMLTLYSDDGTAEGKIDFYDSESVSAMTGIVKKFNETLEKKGVELAIVLPPRSADVFVSALPALYPSYRTDRLFAQLSEELEGTGYIDLLDMYRKKYDSGEYVYYRTDHHWTTLGAYYAYVEIMESFGYEPYSLDAFDVSVMSDEFYGTTWSKSGMRFVKPDTMERFILSDTDDSDYTSVINDKTYAGGGLTGFYDYSKLETKDKYAVFFGGSYSHTSISLSSGEDRETLLLLKDSFGHSVAPFLALHFDIEMVDLTYADSGLDKYFERYDIDKVVVILNAENVISSQYLARLRVSDR
ncbi:MAG TPA: DHHW family protein [Bacillota bacterium]|nr:DHHW family protein [Bacillota bacterium]